MLSEQYALIYSPRHIYWEPMMWQPLETHACNLALQPHDLVWICQKRPGWSASMSPHLDLFPGLQILCLKLGLILFITPLYQKFGIEPYSLTVQIHVNRVCSPLTWAPKTVTYTWLVLVTACGTTAAMTLTHVPSLCIWRAYHLLACPTSPLSMLGVKRRGSGARLPVHGRPGIQTQGLWSQGC